LDEEKNAMENKTTKSQPANGGGVMSVFGEDKKPSFKGKTTYITAWAGSGNLYSLIECCDETYERRIVATFDELTAEQNRQLSARCAAILNDTPTTREGD
jgi:hypothetical protein